MRILPVALVLLFFQGPNPNLGAGEPFSVIGGHPGTNTISFRLIINDAQVEMKSVSALVANEIRFERPAGLPVGLHNVKIEAVNASTKTASETISLPVEAPQSGSCQTAPLTLNMTEWQRAVAMRDPKGMVLGWTIRGPARVTRLQIDLVDDGTPGWEVNYAATGLDGRDVFGMRIAPKKVGKYTLTMSIEDERGCRVELSGASRIVEIVK